MLTPFLIGLALLGVGPALAGLPLALSSFNLVQAPSFAGLNNFRELLDDDLFRQSLVNTLVYAGIAVPLRLAGALLLAVLMAAKLRGIVAFRGAVYLPTVIPDVAWALVWLWVLNPVHGPLNHMLGLAGVQGPQWFADGGSARAAVILMLFWQLGEGFIICLAALTGVPRELLDQAAVDGGSSVQTFLRITLPVIAPLLLVLLARDTAASLKATAVPALIFDQSTGMREGGYFLPNYIYQTAFEYLRFGYASAMTWALYALTALAIWLEFRIVQRWRVALDGVE
jgi:multiple sugar transport system permease protein